MANIVAFIQLILKLIEVGDRLGKVIKEKRLEDWINEVDNNVAKIEDKNTSLKDRVDSARNLIELTRGL